MLNKHAGICRQSTDRTANVAVDFEYLFDTARNNERRGQSFLNSQHDSVARVDSNRSRPELQLSIFVVSTFIASIAYSTWNSLPSGENVLTPRSYSARF